VEENKKFFTDAQFKRAKVARHYFHSVGCPTLQNFKFVLRQNIHKNVPVTPKDIDIAEKIFGPDLGTYKGKKTRQKASAARDDLIEIPPEIKAEHKELILCMDIMYVNRMPVLTSIDTSIRHRCSVPLKNRTAKEIYRGLDVIFRAYDKAGFRIKDLHCDGEFKSIMDVVCDDLSITMNYTTRDEHVPEAERNNRTIGERIRVTYHNLPFSKIPRVMLRILAEIVTHQLNIYPAKGGVSPYYSPFMIMKNRTLDYNKHCQHLFGSYVQATHETNPTNTLAPRTIDCIYLRPLFNKQGGHELMDLRTGMVITRSRVWEFPMTDVVIRAVEAMAEAQGIQTLKLQGRNKYRLFPADWEEGVEYEAENYDDDDYEEFFDDDRSIEDEDLDDEVEDEEIYDPVDQDEVEALVVEPEEDEEIYENVPPVVEDVQDGDEDDDPDETDDEIEVVEGDADEPEEPEVIDVDEDVPRTRSGRAITKPDVLTYSNTQRSKSTVKFANDVCGDIIEMCHHMKEAPGEETLYDAHTAGVIAGVMNHINTKATAMGASYAQQYVFQKGMKIFKERGSKAAQKELDQLHQRNCFTPVDYNLMSKQEKEKTVEAIMFLSEKRTGAVKGRMVYNGKPTRKWLSREESASPTVALESIMLTAMIDAQEGRDVMSADVPNAFVQATMPEVKDGDARVIMKITGVLADLLVELSPEIYGPFVTEVNGRKVLYVQVLQALYGMLISALLWYTQFRAALEAKGFKFNPYDPCVCNRIVRKKQHTVRFHVDDLKSSHVDPRVNDSFLKWLNSKYGNYGEVVATRGKVHEYLGMTFDFSEKGKVKVGMTDYMSAMVDDFPIKLMPSDTAPTPAAEDLLTVGDSPDLDKKQAEVFHTFVAKGLFACKRARPDIHTAIAYLCTRVRGPNQSDWTKLVRMLKYINGTRQDKLTLSADDLSTINWYVDASFAVHADKKSHTGGCMIFSMGAGITISRKQKLNTRSSTESELVGADDVSTMILWTKLFMEAQGYPILSNILNQDNKSTILLEENGKKSSSKRTRAIDIRYFFLTDQVEKGNVTIKYCPTAEMIADYFTKPLQGALFQKFRKAIMGVGGCSQKGSNRSVLARKPQL
jgi:hypothetical protein